MSGKTKGNMSCPQTAYKRLEIFEGALLKADTLQQGYSFRFVVFLLVLVLCVLRVLLVLPRRRRARP